MKKIVIYLILLFFILSACSVGSYLLYIAPQEAGETITTFDYGSVEYIKLPGLIIEQLENQEFLKVTGGLGCGFLLFFCLSGSKGSKKKLRVKNKPHQKDICVDYSDKGSVELMEYESELDKTLKHVTYINGVRGEKESKKGGIVYGSEIVKKGKKTIEKIYFEDDNKHTLILGATGTGKSRTLLLPTIWNMAMAGESMVISDPKGELFKMAQPGLKKAGYNVILINLDDPFKGSTWDAMATIKRNLNEGKVTEATDCAINMAKILCAKSLNSSGDPIWANASYSTIASLIMLTDMEAPSEDQKHMGTVYELLARKSVKDSKNVSELQKYIDQLPLNHPAAKLFAMARSAGGNTFTSIVTSTISDLSLFNNEKGIRLTKDAGFDMVDVTNNKTAVFMLIPHGASTFNDLAGLFIEQLYGELIAYATSKGNLLPRRVNFLLDEFGNLPIIPDFAKKLTIARGYGIRFIIAVQAYQQIEAKYKEDLNTILGNVETIYISIKDVETNKKFSEKLGNYTMRGVNISNSSSSGGSGQSGSDSSSESYSTQQRPVFYPEELEKIEKGLVIVSVTKKNPCVVKTPDLSQYTCNHSFFGMVEPSKDLDHDIKANAEILMARDALFLDYSYDTSKPLIYWQLEPKEAEVKPGEPNETIQAQEPLDPIEALRKQAEEQGKANRAGKLKIEGPKTKPKEEENNEETSTPQMKKRMILKPKPIVSEEDLAKKVDSFFDEEDEANDED